LQANKVEQIVVVDARNPDFSVEPDDEMYGGPTGTAPISDCGTAKRPNAVNAAFDRVAKALPLALVETKTKGDKTTPIVTHCGGGGRGQKAKEYLTAQGYTNVINGGGPAVKELWDKFGTL
jgi:rhodanese-related sulfurtransferase